jgi:UDP-glucose:(heptosyl)LPS alpha-1,3-glucosyltransferase
VETATAGLLEELRRRGHDLHLVSTRAQADLPGIRVHRVPTLRHPSLLRLYSFALAARRVSRRLAADVVQSHERGLEQDVYRAGEGTHLGYLEALGRSGRRGPYDRAVCALEARIFRLAAARHVVANSRLCRDEISRRFGPAPSGLSVIENGVDLARFHPELRGRIRGEARQALGLAPGDFAILFVGSGFERKGLDVLIRGLAALGAPRARVVVAGKGRTAPYRALAAELGVLGRVSWLGVRSDVERLYAAADALALPARYEPFGNVVLEAMAAGVPVLTSASVGFAEHVRQGDNGWVVGALEAGAVADGLRTIMEADPARLARLARESAEPFTFARQAGAFERLYGQLARR